MKFAANRRRIRHSISPTLLAPSYSSLALSLSRRGQRDRNREKEIEKKAECSFGRLGSSSEVVQRQKILLMALGPPLHSEESLIFVSWLSLPASSLPLSLQIYSTVVRAASIQPRTYKDSRLESHRLSLSTSWVCIKIPLLICNIRGYPDSRRVIEFHGYHLYLGERKIEVRVWLSSILSREPKPS